MSEGTPLHGDRSAWDTTDHADEHARDIDENSMKRHLPAPGNIGNSIYDDGSKWYSGPSSGSGHSHEMDLDDLENVEAGSPAHGEFLTYDGVVGDWRPTSGSTPPIANLDDVGDVNAPSPNDGDALLWDDGAGEWTSGSTGGGTGGGHVIEDEGVGLAQRTKLNFEGTGVTVTDDAGDDASVVTIPTDLEWDLVTNGDSVDPGLVFTEGDVVWTKL